MTQKQINPDGEERYATLTNNAGAIRAICSAVEGTLGPKGLDTMLVGPQGEVIITNDGVTILEKMDVTHPAARLLIQVAHAQQEQVGDGTTTATVLAGALLNEGVAQVMKGVPAAKVVRGIEQAALLAAESLRRRSIPVEGLDDPLLHRTAFIAGREHADIARLVIEAAQVLGPDRLRDPGLVFADAVTSHEKAGNEVWPGLLLHKKPMNMQMEIDQEDARVLVLHDALEPDPVDEEALSTELGFRQYMENKELFRANLKKLAELGIKFIAADRGVHQEAEQFFTDLGIMVLQRVSKADLQLICEHTGARPLKRIGLHKTKDDLSRYLGLALKVSYDEKISRIRVIGGSNIPMVTIIVGASTHEVVGERARIAKDAASAVQAALRGGYLPGGGAVEIAVARELERYRETVKDMEAFGVEAVIQALRKPLAQIVVNAGFNPLEKVEQAKAAQLAQDTDRIGIDCDTGKLMDCLEQGIVDPALVKIHALKAASEVAGAILRIHTVIKMKSMPEL
ncbi:chaperonin [Paenibacillus swuensis]|uniref:Chaperonin n=1 Tax=Paenibacillus swuensis TaxID=1178515 RepID=A0A172TJU2_9BACL|nr:TCP-1/cpn60 chaperonin family protein [Paenibacillus swuensis]ANE47290.1 chaperonin [Paenibacillus swuensis]